MSADSADLSWVGIIKGCIRMMTISTTVTNIATRQMAACSMTMAMAMVAAVGLAVCIQTDPAVEATEDLINTRYTIIEMLVECKCKLSLVGLIVSINDLDPNFYSEL